MSHISRGVMVGCYGLCRGMWTLLPLSAAGRVPCSGRSTQGLWSTLVCPRCPAPAVILAVRVAGPLRRRPTCRNITFSTRARSRSCVSSAIRASPGLAPSRLTWQWSTSKRTASAASVLSVLPGCSGVLWSRLLQPHRCKWLQFVLFLGQLMFLWAR